MTLDNLENTIPEGISTSNIGEVVLKQSPILICINPQVLSFLKKEYLDINMLFILVALYDDNYAILDQYDENNTRLDIYKLEYQNLYLKGFIEDCEENYQFQISDKGTEFIDRVRSLFEYQDKPTNTSSINLKKLCIEYLELWPKIKFPSKSYARASIIEIEKKMSKFLKTNITAF